MDKKDVLPYAGAGSVMGALVTGGVLYWRRRRLLLAIEQPDITPLELLESSLGDAKAAKTAWSNTLEALKRAKALSPSAVITAIATIQINWAERRFKTVTARAEGIEDSIKKIEAREAASGEAAAE